MRHSISNVPSASICNSRLLITSGLLLGCCPLFAGCNKTPAPAATPIAPATTANTQQQVQNDPNISPEKKQQILDSMARSNAAEKDPRNMQGRPTPTSR